MFCDDDEISQIIISLNGVTPLIGVLSIGSDNAKIGAAGALWSLMGMCGV